jgi:hypothetical protein
MGRKEFNLRQMKWQLPLWYLFSLSIAKYLLFSSQYHFYLQIKA